MSEKSNILLGGYKCREDDSFHMEDVLHQYFGWVMT